MNQARADFQTSRLFLVSTLTLFTAGLSFSLRSGIITTIESDYLRAIDPAGSGVLAGQLLGITFTGFAITLFLGSSFLDKIGMGRGLILSASSFVIGTGLAIAAPSFAGESIYTWLWCGFLLSGLGWGFMEATVNPLVTALYPDDKIHRLNVVHAWWPAGIIVGGLIEVGAGALGWGWQTRFGIVIVPAVIAILLCAGTRFPRTERATLGVSMGDMFREIFRQPMFLVWWLCMFLTAASELAPGQWIDLTLTRTVGMRGIWLLIYVSGMMFVLRHFAGPIAHRISTTAMLWGSAVLATLGLLALAQVDSPATGIAAATVWGLGVCFFWPTMLANVSERFPRGGEFFIGLMGVAGALAIQMVLPALGGIFDQAKIELAGGEAAYLALEGEPLAEILRSAAATSFQTLAILPALLIVIFGVLFAIDRKHKTQAQRDEALG
ncbi:MAG: MFS transporter [Deltaproteobacteria bacterium]|nr:MFS transporter [Deltaproteobacteria bacterium]MBW2394975.1 MFS transporter [Deltaproteobacteria bacterium]